MLLRWDTSENLCPNNNEVFVSFPPEKLPFHHFQNIKKGQGPGTVCPSTDPEVCMQDIQNYSSKDAGGEIESCACIS